MKPRKVPGIVLASLIAVIGLGLTSDEANAGGKNKNQGGKSGYLEGTCSTSDVFAGGVSASSCGNFTGNDSQVKFVDYLNGKSFSELNGFDANLDGDFASTVNALDGTWSLFGKSDEGGDGLKNIGEEQQTGNWEFTAALEAPFVVVLKASSFYSAYLFDDIDSAITSGTFDVKGVTTDSSKADKFAALSHMSVYSFVPRIKEVEPPTIPEPASIVGLLAVAGLGLRLKKQSQAA